MNVFELFAKLGLDTSEFEKGLDKAKSAGSTLGNGLAKAAKVGMAAVTAATGAVVGFAKTSVSAGADFDSSMSQVAATMGKTMEEMQNEVGSVDLAWGTFSGNLREYAQEMGKNTAFSATEAADALNYMALAGYDTQTSMEMLPNVLNLAAAGSMDLARASDMVTDTQTAFGISLDRTSQMVDEMAKAASTGNTSVEQLGDAFLTVGGLAQELNGGMVTLADGTQKPVDGVQELEIALTAMANAGIKGSEAGTHMRNMLLKLSNPTSDGVTQLEQLGVAVFDTEGNMRSLSDVFGDLSGALGNLTQEQKIQAISDLFNTRDLASAEALLNAVGQDWDGIGESILNAEGAAQQMANTQLDNLAGDITLFKSALEGAQIAVSDVLTPALREFVQFGTDGLSRLTTAFQEGGVSGAMEEFGSILSDGINMIVSKAPEFVEAGIGLLSALGQGLMDNIDVILFAIGDIVEMIFQKMLESSEGEGNIILEIFNWILGVFEENYMQLIDVGMQILINIMNGIIESLPDTIFYISEILNHIVNVLLENLPMLLDLGLQILMMLVDGIIQNLPILVPAVIDIILTIVDKLTQPDMITQLVGAALQIIVAIAEGLISALPKLVAKAPEIIANLVIGLYGAFNMLNEAAVDLIVALINGIKACFGDLVAQGKEVVDTIKNGVKQKIDDAKNWGKDLIQNFINGLKEKWENLKKTVSDIASSIKDFLGFSEPKLGPLSDFHTFAPDMVELFAKGVTDNKKMLDDTIADAFDFEDMIVNADGTAQMNVRGFNGDGFTDGSVMDAVIDALSGVSIEVMIGQERLDGIVTKAIQRSNYKSGGR